MTKFTPLADREKRAVSWISDCLPDCDPACGETRHLVYHLVGTDRAFGLFFPEFFLAGLPFSDPVLLDVAHRMFLASRAYLIADDAVRDRDRSAPVRAILAAAAPRFREACVQAGRDWGLATATIERMLDRRERLCDWSYRWNVSQQGPTVASTCLRCSLWYLTFDALRHNFASALVRPRRRSFTEALFLLQLADDFADIDADLQSESNWSLLGWGAASYTAFFARISRAQLRGFALLAIYGIAQQLASITSVPRTLRRWAEAIQMLIAFPPNMCPDRLVSRLFPGRLPESFCPPALCDELNTLDLTAIEVRGMNGVSFSAESINSFATLRALAEVEDA